jgi:iron(III) transport system permease protein
VARPGVVARWLQVTIPPVGRAALVVGVAVALLCLRDLDTTLMVYPPGGETLAVRILTLEANAPPAQTAALALLQVGLSALLGLACLALIPRRRSP